MLSANIKRKDGKPTFPRKFCWHSDILLLDNTSGIHYDDSLVVQFMEAILSDSSHFFNISSLSLKCRFWQCFFCNNIPLFLLFDESWLIWKAQQLIRFPSVCKSNRQKLQHILASSDILRGNTGTLKINCSKVNCMGKAKIWINFSPNALCLC